MSRPEPEGLTIGELSARTGVAHVGAAVLRGRGPDPRRPARAAVSAATAATRCGGCRSCASPSRSGSASTRSAPPWRRCPSNRTPTRADWERLSASWRPRLDERIALLERLRDDLSGCIGCGCLSLAVCPLYNPDDVLAAKGPGAHILLGDA